MKIIAHRGAAKLAPENSLKAIALSKRLNVDAIEIDVRVTKDNQLVVFHDKNLVRMYGNRLLISDLNLDELTSIKLKNGENIPSLDQVLAAADPTPLIIEGKGSGWSKILTHDLKNYKDRKRLRVISFNKDELKKFKDLNSDISVSIIIAIRSLWAIKIANKNDFQGIFVHFFGLNPLTYYRAKKSNKNICAYTLNNLFITRLVRRFYPKVEIVTDDPIKLNLSPSEVN